MKNTPDENDILFSRMIRQRSENKCDMCGKSQDMGYQMTCSHFFNRNKKSLRFHPDNCDCLCLGCHQKVEGDKSGYYREWKIKRLGEAKFGVIERLFYQGYKCYGLYEQGLLNRILNDHYEKKLHLGKNWVLVW